MSFSSTAMISEASAKGIQLTPEEETFLENFLSAPSGLNDQQKSEYYNVLPPANERYPFSSMRSEILAQLRSSGYNNQTDKFQNSMLHRLIANERTTDAIFFIKVVNTFRKFQIKSYRTAQGANIIQPINFTLQDIEGKTPLLLAIKTRNTQLASAILEQHKNDIDVGINTTDLQGNTPLHYACALGMETIVKKLLKKGASIDAPNLSGKNPIDLTALPATSIRQILNSVSVHADRDEHATYNRITDSYGEPLMIKADMEKYEVTDPEFLTQFEVGGYMAIKKNSAIVIQSLDEEKLVDSIELTRIIKHSTNHPEEKKLNLTPLKKNSQASQITKELVVMQFDEMKGTSLIDVCIAQRSSVCSYMIKQGANFAWLIRAAAATNSIDKLAYLLKQQTAKDYIDEPGNATGQTALHIAAEKDLTDICKMLLDAGADASLNKNDKNSKTPLALAQSANHEETISFLQEYKPRTSPTITADAPSHLSRSGGKP